MSIEIRRWLAAKVIRIALRLTPPTDNGTRVVLSRALMLTLAKEE